MDLKPCPFCGARDVEIRTSCTDTMVACNICGCRTGIVYLGQRPNEYGELEVAQVWNTRVSQQPPITEVERVADCCLPGGACYEAGLSDVQHKVEPLVERVAQALSDSAKASWDQHKVRDDWRTLARAAIEALSTSLIGGGE